MIFVVLGTQKFQCNRLLKTIDDLLVKEKITEDVFAQTGFSDYKPQKYIAVDFLGKKDFEEKIDQCSVLITHGGVGTIIYGMKQGKPVIVFPRLKKYGEHVDDHQLEIATAFSDKNYVLMCGENDDLVKLIEKSRTHPFNKYVSQREQVIRTIQDYLKGIKK